MKEEGVVTSKPRHTIQDLFNRVSLALVLQVKQISTYREDATYLGQLVVHACKGTLFARALFARTMFITTLLAG